MGKHNVFPVSHWGPLLWNCSTIFRQFFCRLVNFCPLLLLTDSASRKSSFYTQSSTEFYPIKLVCCKMFQLLFPIHITNFTAFYFPSTFFSRCVACIESTYYFLNFTIFFIWRFVYFVPLWMKYDTIKVVKYCICFLFTYILFIVTNLVRNWVVFLANEDSRNNFLNNAIIFKIQHNFLTGKKSYIFSIANVFSLNIKASHLWWQLPLAWSHKRNKGLSVLSNLFQ